MKLKLLISAFALLSFLFININVSHAQIPRPESQATPSASSNYLNANPDVPTNLHTYTQSVFIELASTISCFLTGTDPINSSSKCLGIDEKTHKIGYVEGGGGAIGMVGGLISSTFYMPISTHQYVADAISNFGLTKQTYAQDASRGVGFNALLPTLTMWKAFRNIAYMLFTLIFIIIGLGIMFRIKLDPRTVMGLQNTIPKIILALIFITFSYAIAGFLVDLMYVSIYLIIGIFAQQGYDTSSAVAANPFAAIGGLGGFHDIGYGVATSISSIVSGIFDGTLGNIVGAIIGALIGKMVGGFAGGFLQGVPFGSTIANLVGVGGGAVVGAIAGNKAVGLFAGVVTYIVIIIAIFSALLRLWFTLIKCYLYVFLTVVFSPFYVAMGVIPGQSGVGGWLKGMVANLSVFPATVVMFLLGKAFIDGFTHGQVGTTQFVPPLIGNFADPEKMAAIIGLAVILLTPEIANMIRDALKAGDLKQGSAIGRGLGAGIGLVSAPFKGFAGGMFGQNRDGTSKPGTAWLGNTFGGWARTLSGGQAEDRAAIGRGRHFLGFNFPNPARTLKQTQQMVNSNRVAGPGNRALRNWNGDEATRPVIRGERVQGPSQNPPPGWTPPGPGTTGTSSSGSSVRVSGRSGQQPGPTSTIGDNKPQNPGDEGRNDMPPPASPSPVPNIPPSNLGGEGAAVNPPPNTPSEMTEEEALASVEQKEHLANQMREGLHRQNYNETSIGRVLGSHFDPEILTSDLTELKRLSEEQKNLLNEAKSENEKAHIKTRLLSIEAKIKKIGRNTT